MNTNYDITDIEQTVIAAVKAMGISDKVYSSRPKAVPESSTDFIVVKVQGQVNDLAALARCTIGVHLFAKDVRNVKNGAKLSYMQKGITEQFPGKCGNLLIDNHPRILGDAPDDFGFHARVILFNNVTIKSV